MSSTQAVGRVYSATLEVRLQDDLSWKATTPDAESEAELLNNLELWGSKGFGDPVDMCLERGADTLGWQFERLIPRDAPQPGLCY